MSTIPDLYDERDLLLRMAGGDEDAFASIYAHYLPEINRFILGYLKLPELVSDVSQEIFLKVWNEREKMKGLESFKAYLLVMTRNQTISALRKVSMHEKAVGLITRKYLESPSTGTDEILTREYQDFLQKTLAALPPKSREVFLLCREEKKSYEEVAALLRISPSTVKYHMSQSMQLLKQAVERDLGIPLSLFLLIISF